ncbi:MAG: ABC transporter ATP-binding protein [Cyanobacteria bacterium P01_D01_bin.73]
MRGWNTATSVWDLQGFECNYGSVVAMAFQTQRAKPSKTPEVNKLMSMTQSGSVSSTMTEGGRIRLVEVREVTKRFDRHIAVDGISLKIQAGEVYGLIGPNGAGKTTLIRMLVGAERPTLGEVVIDGISLNDGDRRKGVAQQIGFLPDDFPVYDDLSVWEYLDYFGRLYGLHGRRLIARIYDVLALVKLDHKRDAKANTLSRGMKQRLSLARTVIHEPTLLLLDEPVSGLDPIARNEFRQIVRSLHEAGMTILISSHVLSDLAELCTCVGIMETGNLIASAPLSELYERFSRQTLHLQALDRLNDLQGLLADNEHVGVMEINQAQKRIVAEFHGSEGDRAALLQGITAAGISLVDFRCDQDDLEQIFLKLGSQQTS